jgi:hypothetical protein
LVMFHRNSTITSTNGAFGSFDIITLLEYVKIRQNCKFVQAFKLN